MGEEKENKRERYENINIECPLMEKKWGGGHSFCWIVQLSFCVGFAYLLLFVFIFVLGW